MHKKKYNQGFTIPELVIGIIIIGILLTGLVGMLSRYRAQAEEDARQAKFIEVQDMVNKEFLRLQLTSGETGACFENYTQALLNVSKNRTPQVVTPGYTFVLDVEAKLTDYAYYDDWESFTGTSKSRKRMQATKADLTINGRPVDGQLILPDKFCNTF